MIWKGFRFAIAIISGKFIFNFGIAERLRTLRYPIFTGGGVTENGSSSACFLRKCGAAGTAKDLISEENDRVQCEQTGGAYAVFYAKSLQKRLKVLFMVSEICDTLFTGKAPEQNRNTGGEHHEGF